MTAQLLAIFSIIWLLAWLLVKYLQITDYPTISNIWLLVWLLVEYLQITDY